MVDFWNALTEPLWHWLKAVLSVWVILRITGIVAAVTASVSEALRKTKQRRTNDHSKN